MINSVLHENVTTRMLIELYQYMRKLCKDTDLNVYRLKNDLYDLLIEFGFRRDIEFHGIVINDNTSPHDSNVHTTYVHNLTFIQALINGEFVVPESIELIIYPLAIAVVCISKKCSLDTLERLLDCMQKAFSVFGCYYDERYVNVYFDALSYVIASMENCIDFNSIVHNHKGLHNILGRHVDRRPSDASERKPYGGIDVYKLLAGW